MGEERGYIRLVARKDIMQLVAEANRIFNAVHSSVSGFSQQSPWKRAIAFAKGRRTQQSDETRLVGSRGLRNASR